MLSLTLAIVVASLLLYIINLAINANKHWERRGIKALKPIIFFGNTLPIVLKKKNLAEIYRDLYNAYPDEPITGFYENMSPHLVIQDPDYVENVLIKDFGHFVDHSSYCPDEKKLPIDHYHLFSMRGSKWRAYRYKMTPLFTSGKLKQMFQVYDIVGEKLIEFLDNKPKQDIILKDVMHLYTLDFVGQAVFGINSCVLENPGCEYHRMGINVFDLNYFKVAFSAICPTLYQALGLSFNNKKSVKYFCKIIEDAFNYRKENNIKRNDFIQMMLQLKEKGKIEILKWDPNDDYLKEENYTPTESFEISDISLMAQAYAFMTTGLDGVSLSLQFAFFQLSLNQEIQDKVRAEINEQVKMHSGLTYDALKSMSYLENVVSETFRIHPLSQSIMRVCTKDYTFPNGFKIKEGEMLHIPQLAIHMDPQIHNDPEQFKPERFEYPMRAGTYFPFGDGPRVCIAMRFALLQVKYGLAKVLLNYKVKLSSRTKLPLKMKPQSIMLEPDGIIYFDLEKV